jgi:hypothetical protein
MARKTETKKEKEDKLIVGTEAPMHEGERALENFEKLAKRIFAVKAAKNE